MNDVTLWSDLLRTLVTAPDRGLYGCLENMYTLLFSVANSEIIDGAFVAKFFGRVQLIIGVFMMFQLAITILKGIMNPDNFTNEKSGAGNVISRMVISLAMLTLLVPINITSPSNEYEKQINNNGLLFGTLYSLQNRILSNNTLAKLVLGGDFTDYPTTATYSNSNPFEISNKMGRELSTSIIRKYITFNVNEENGDPMNPDDRVCASIDSNVENVYLSEDSSTWDIFNLVNEKCTLSDYSQAYVFSLNFPLLSSVVGIVLVFLLLALVFEVAVRAVKLAVLRLIAPIPIISYMDPKGGKDGAFSSWVKLLGTTYLELFIKLAVIYFIISIVQNILTNGITGPEDGTYMGGMTWVWIVIGLFIFAKEADKFIKQALGLKDNGGKFFGAIGQAMGLGAAATGAVSGAVSGGISRAQNTSGSTGKKIASGILGGFVGGVGSAANGMKMWRDSKDGDAKKIWNANMDYAAKNWSNNADDSTVFGRMKAMAQSGMGLQNDFQKMEDKMKYYNAASDALGRITKAFDGNGDYKFTYSGDEIKDSSGNTILKSGDKKSLKDMNDLCNFYSSDGIASKALDKAKKDAQGERFSAIRKMTRSKIVDEINKGNMSTNDLVVYDSGRTIYDVASKYSDQPEFARFKDSSGKMRAYDDNATFVDDSGKTIEYLNFGYAFKHDAGQAGKTADQIKNSNEYAQAKANAQRAAEAKKK